MSLALVHSATRGAVRKGSRLSHTQPAPFPLAYDPALTEKTPTGLPGHGLQITRAVLSIVHRHFLWKDAYLRICGHSDYEAESVDVSVHSPENTIEGPWMES